MWVVCGAPRTGTTAMLEAIASWTTLAVRYDIGTEWRSRAQTGMRETFLENGAGGAGPNDVVKILNPAFNAVDVSRAILMIRDPEAAAASARRNLGQRMTAQDVTARLDAFRAKFEHIDEVRFAELGDLANLFARLASRGWPVVGRCSKLRLVADRPNGDRR
jgi:hypothetical protein